MYIPITTAALALLTVAMILLRVFWDRLPSLLRFVLIRTSIALVLLQVFFAATKWGTTSNHWNAFISWLAVASYELLILLFSRLSPRWLTSISATILLIPLFAASILFPLTDLFSPWPNNNVSINRHFFYEIKPWGSFGSANDSDGVDLLVCYRPAFAPFLRRKIQTIPFNNRECHAMAVSATISPDSKTVVASCPSWPSAPPRTVEKLLRLP
jgi:hypothetical protein